MYTPSSSTNPFYTKKYGPLALNIKDIDMCRTVFVVVFYINPVLV